MAVPLELIGTGIAAVLGGIGELYRRGKLRLGPKRNGMNGSDRETLGEIHETVTHVDEKVEDIEEKTDRNAYLIQEFHGDQTVDVDVDDVLGDDDFYRSADD